MSIWDSIQNIVLLFESDKAEGNTDIQDIILQLRAEGKNVAAWGYVPKYTIYSAQGTIFRILGKDDTTLCGKVSKQHLQAWDSVPCDLLLDLTLQDVRPLQHLATTSTAKLKAGKEREGNMYQFMIQVLTPNSERQTANGASRITLCQQIVHYLKTIQLS